MVSRHVLTLAPKNHLRSDQLHPLNVHRLIQFG